MCWALDLRLPIPNGSRYLRHATAVANNASASLQLADGVYGDAIAPRGKLVPLIYHIYESSLPTLGVLEWRNIYFFTASYG
jgi:hypothetical protein